MVEEKNCDIPINGINQGHQNQVDASFCKKQKLNYLNCKTTNSSQFMLPQGNNREPWAGLEQKWRHNGRLANIQIGLTRA